MQSLTYTKDELIESLIEKFIPRFVPGSEVVHANDSRQSLNETKLRDLGVADDKNQKMPDVVLYQRERNWLLVVDSTTSNGPISEKRLKELAEIFSKAKPDLVYVTAFQSRSDMADYPDLVAWGTHAWFADEPEHMIHFNGSRFLGPYS